MLKHHVFVIVEMVILILHHKLAASMTSFVLYLLFTWSTHLLQRPLVQRLWLGLRRWLGPQRWVGWPFAKVEEWGPGVPQVWAAGWLMAAMVVNVFGALGSLICTWNLAGGDTLGWWIPKYVGWTTLQQFGGQIEHRVTSFALRKYLIVWKVFWQIFLVNGRSLILSLGGFYLSSIQ